MKTTAVILSDVNKVEIDEIEVADPGPEEVRVKVLASGICGSDTGMIAGHYTPPLPVVPGHEIAGVIEAVGHGVDERRVGEHVVCAFAAPCRKCDNCLGGGPPTWCPTVHAAWAAGGLFDGTPRYSWKGKPLHQALTVGGWSGYAVVPDTAAVAIADSLDPALACVIGCCVPTSMVPLVENLHLRPGQAIAVFGAGGVGLAAIVAAAMVSAYPIVAADLAPERRELALKAGATHVFDPAETDVPEAVKELCGGVDISVDAVGLPQLTRAGRECLNLGGQMVVLGITSEDPLDLAGWELIDGDRSLHGFGGGGAMPLVHHHRFARLAAAGPLDLSKVVTHRYPMAEAEKALEQVAAGVGGRSVLIPH